MVKTDIVLYLGGEAYEPFKKLVGDGDLTFKIAEATGPDLRVIKKVVATAATQAEPIDASVTEFAVRYSVSHFEVVARLDLTFKPFLTALVDAFASLGDAYRFYANPGSEMLLMLTDSEDILITGELLDASKALRFDSVAVETEDEYFRYSL
jgi:hypothetical protein